MASVIRFDCYEVDPSSRELRKFGVRIHLREQSFQVLWALLRHPGELVTRDKLRQELWPNEVFVDFENGLNTAVARLREALSDTADHPKYIETLPRRGYRFLAEASEVQARHPRPAAGKMRLLVLPFTNLSGAVDLEYFCDAITDDVITAIAERGWLAVIARTTAMRYKNAEKDVATINHELSLDFIVEGSVRRADNRVALNVQVIRTEDESHIFARKFEGAMGELFKMESAIADAIVAQIAGEGLAIAGMAQAPRRLQPTGDLVAYQWYVQGRSQMYRQTPASFPQAKHCLEEAIARDRQFAVAHAALGELFWWAGFFGLRAPKEAFTASLGATVRALQIDNTLGEAHGLLGKLRHHLDYDWEAVNRELAEAVRISPYSSLVRFCYATSGFIPHGRLDECISELEQALEIDPLSLLLRSWVGIGLWLARNYDRAMAEARRVEALEPNSHFAHIGIGNILRDSGNLKEAIECHRAALTQSGGSPQLLGWLGLDLGINGDRSEARQILGLMHGISEKTYVSPTSFAWVYLGLGEIDKAFEWMNNAIEERDPNINPIQTFPFLDPIRNDSRYPSLLRKMCLVA